MKEKQSQRLTSTRRSLPISLLRTRELIMEEIRPVLLRHEITEQQWRVLRVIDESGEAIDASNLANRACLLAPSLTRILKRLDSRGLITLIKDHKDGRRILVSLTDEGRTLIDKVAPESIAVFSKLRAIVSDERWEALVTLLADIRDDINQARKHSD